MSALVQDLRFTLRALRRKPGFTIVAVLTLALGIGANAAIFSVVDGVLLRPLPYPEPDRLERLFVQTRENRFALSVADFQFLAETQKSFAGLALYRSERLTLTDAERPRRVAVTWVTARYFDVLGVKARLGRTFVPGEDRPGEERVVVASHRFWEQHFGADVKALDRYVKLDGLAYRMVGVMPREFRPPASDAELWAVEQLALATARGPFFHDAVARRAAGIDRVQAQRNLLDLSRAVYERWTDAFIDRKAVYSMVPLSREVVGDVGRTLYVLLGAVAFVLLMATANVAHLLLAKASSRRREMALRATLGASHRRLVQQLATESAVLAVLGGLAGLAVASWGLDLLLALSPDNLPRLDEVRVNGRVLGFTAAITVLAGLLCGLAPIKSSLTFGLAARLSGDGPADGPSNRRTRGLLVAAELALALPLLVAAGLMIRTFFELRQVDPGFNPHDTLSVHVSLPETTYPETGDVRTFYDELLGRILAIPGVRSAGLASSLPPEGLLGRRTFAIDGLALDGDSSPPVAGWITASPGLFETLQIPLVQGRRFTGRDREGSLPVAIIDETLVRRYFPKGGAVGRRVRAADCLECPWLTVVGVVRRVKYSGLGAADQPTIYVSQRQQAQRAMHLVVRSPQEPAFLFPELQRSVGELDAGLALAEASTLDRLLVDSMAAPRYRMGLLGTFAALALALAAIGIYGVLTYSVRQRSREIGIRMALGAQAGSVRRLVLGQGLGHVAAGVAAGVLATLALTRFLASLLYGVSSTDPAIVVGVTLVLVGVAFFACFLPAHRATRIDPILVLREE